MPAAGASAAAVVPHVDWGNDFSCHPSATHPRPVVLLHGAGATAEQNFTLIGPTLQRAGYCVFALTYGIGPLGRPGSLPMEQSAAELGQFVARVRGATGAREVDFVGHSEGTMMPRYYLDRLGGARYVKRYVALAPLWRGTAFGGAMAFRDYTGIIGPLAIGLVNTFCGACQEILGGSAYLNGLNADGEPSPGVEHINIVTRYDTVVVPYTSGLMRGGGTNVILQDVCPDDHSGHVALAFDPHVMTLIQGALDDHQRDPC